MCLEEPRLSDSSPLHFAGMTHPPAGRLQAGPSGPRSIGRHSARIMRSCAAYTARWSASGLLSRTNMAGESYGIWWKLGALRGYQEVLTHPLSEQT